MFGHQDNQHDEDNMIPEPAIDDALAADDVHAAAVADDVPADDAVNPALPNDTAVFNTSEDADSAAPQGHDEPASRHNDSDNSSVQRQDDDILPAPGADGGTNDLLDIKTQALQQLSPLVDHLDQSPEEKFRTTMMMIQASDDQNLVKTAYEAARQISDEKTKAQALLDIVNEINYFTHQGNNEA